jgi:hypothetical protein
MHDYSLAHILEFGRKLLNVILNFKNKIFLQMR